MKKDYSFHQVAMEANHNVGCYCSLSDLLELTQGTSEQVYVRSDTNEAGIIWWDDGETINLQFADKPFFADHDYIAYIAADLASDLGMNTRGQYLPVQQLFTSDANRKLLFQEIKRRAASNLRDYSFRLQKDIDVIR